MAAPIGRLMPAAPASCMKTRREIGFLSANAVRTMSSSLDIPISHSCSAKIGNRLLSWRLSRFCLFESWSKELPTAVARQATEYPPSTMSKWPVMPLAASEARKATAEAISAGFIRRPVGRIVEPHGHGRRAGPADLGEHFRVRVARPDGVDADPLLRPFDGEDTAHMGDGGLRHVVADMHLGPHRLHAGDRGDRDDRAGLGPRASAGRRRGCSRRRRRD